MSCFNPLNTYNHFFFNFLVFFFFCVYFRLGRSSFLPPPPLFCKDPNFPPPPLAFFPFSPFLIIIFPFFFYIRSTMNYRTSHTAVLKRSREEEESEVRKAAGCAAMDHLLATPPRSTNGSACLIPSNPFMAPVHCSRSPSVCTSGTEGGLSEDSVFVLDISSHSCSVSRRRSGPSAAPSEAEVAKWQKELSDFFTRLDQRSLRIAPHQDRSWVLCAYISKDSGRKKKKNNDNCEESFPLFSFCCFFFFRRLFLMSRRALASLLIKVQWMLPCVF